MSVSHVGVPGFKDQLRSQFWCVGRQQVLAPGLGFQWDNQILPLFLSLSALCLAHAERWELFFSRVTAPTVLVSLTQFVLRIGELGEFALLAGMESNGKDSKTQEPRWDWAKQEGGAGRKGCLVQNDSVENGGLPWCAEHSEPLGHRVHVRVAYVTRQCCEHFVPLYFVLFVNEGLWWLWMDRKPEHVQHTGTPWFQPAVLEPGRPASWMEGGATGNVSVICPWRDADTIVALISNDGKPALDSS